MSAIFIVTLILLAAIAYSIYRKQQELNSYRADSELSPPRPPRSLFEEGRGAEEQPAEEPSRAETERRAALHTQAAEGDYTALADAHRTGDPALYQSVLGESMKWAAQSEDNLRALASFVAADKELRGSAELAEAYRQLWQQSPDQTTTARLLHLAALSDDPETFARALDAAAQAWREGRLAQLSAEDFRALAESEFWVLSASARVAGAGFVLKQRLAALREELAM